MSSSLLLSCTRQRSTVLTLEWSSLAAGTSYLLRMVRDPPASTDGGQLVFEPAYIGSLTSYTMTHLTPDTSYAFQVCTFVQDEVRDCSAVLNVRTSASDPADVASFDQLYTLQSKETSRYETIVSGQSRDASSRKKLQKPAEPDPHALDVAVDILSRKNHRFILFVSDESTSLTRVDECSTSPTSSYTDFVSSLTANNEPRCALLSFTYRTAGPTPAHRKKLVFISYVPDDLPVRRRFYAGAGHASMHSAINTQDSLVCQCAIWASCKDDLELNRVWKKAAEHDSESIDFNAGACVDVL